MKKRVFTSIIALLAMVGMARAATDYGLSISGVPITSDNYQNLSSLGLTSGTMTFDPTSGTLTLDNVTLDNYPKAMEGIVFDNSYFSRFRLKLIGNNKVTGINNTPLMLLQNASLIIEGPGKLETNIIFLQHMCTLSICGATVTATSVSGSSASSTIEFLGCNASFSRVASCLYEVHMLRAHYTNSNIVISSTGGLVNSSGNYVAVTVVPDLPPIDFKKDNKIDAYDIYEWLNFKYGAYQATPNVDQQSADLYADGNLSAADLVMLGNYMTGTRPVGWGAPSRLRDNGASEFFYPNTPRNIICGSYPQTTTWTLYDQFPFGGRFRDDPDITHYSVSSSNRDVAEVSLVPNSTTKVYCYRYQITMKKTGFTNITLRYDDKLGNKVEMKVPLTVYQNSDLFASGDKLYGFYMEKNGYRKDSPYDLYNNMDVPVGSTIALTVDKALNGYDIATHSKRVACANWEVTGNNNVTVEKVSDHVLVHVNGPGTFTVSATDKSNKKLSATFRACDVYTYDKTSVYKNGEKFFGVPKRRSSSMMGATADFVYIAKMVTGNGKVYTVVNHYCSEYNSLMGNTRNLRTFHIVPIYAEVYCNQERVFEAEGVFLQDIAVNEYDETVAVGFQYNPTLSYEETDDNKSPDLKDCQYSLRRSAYCCYFNLTTDARDEYGYDNPKKLESTYDKVVWDDNADEWCMLGTAARKKTAWGETIYPKDWIFERRDQIIYNVTASYRRAENNNFTYRISGLAFDGDKPVGLMQVIRYEHFEPFDRFMFDKYYPDQLVYDFSKTNDSGKVALNETVSSDGYTHYPLQGIDAGKDSNRIIGWGGNKYYEIPQNTSSYSVLVDPNCVNIQQKTPLKNGSTLETFSLQTSDEQKQNYDLYGRWGILPIKQIRPEGFSLMIP